MWSVIPCYCGNEIKTFEFGKSVARNEDRSEMYTGFFSGILNGRNRLENLGVEIHYVQ